MLNSHWAGHIFFKEEANKSTQLVEYLKMYGFKVVFACDSYIILIDRSLMRASNIFHFCIQRDAILSRLSSGLFQSTTVRGSRSTRSLCSAPPTQKQNALQEKIRNCSESRNSNYGLRTSSLKGVRARPYMGGRTTCTCAKRLTRLGEFLRRPTNVA